MILLMQPKGTTKQKSHLSCLFPIKTKHGEQNTTLEGAYKVTWVFHTLTLTNYQELHLSEHNVKYYGHASSQRLHQAYVEVAMTL